MSIGDTVVSKSCPAFWMTITELLSCGYARCRFGSVGPDAGSYLINDLEPWRF